MKRHAYRCYTNIFGHTKLINKFVNNFSDHAIQMGDSVKTGRKTRISGDVDIGSHASIGPNCKVRGNVDIGPDVSIRSNCHVRGDVNIGRSTNINGDNVVLGEVSIGKYCAIASRARMRTRDHATYKPGMQMGFYSDIGGDLPSVSKGPIEIGNDVWICSDAKILSDVTIGDGAVIAADSVVVNDVDPYSIVAGNPATHKKYRFDQDTIEALQEISWWDWSRQKQKQNLQFFNSDLRDVNDIRSLIN